MIRMYEKWKLMDLSGEILENAFFANTVLKAELLPEFHADLVPALSYLQCDDFSRHSVSTFFSFFSGKLGLRIERKCVYLRHRGFKIVERRRK